MFSVIVSPRPGGEGFSLSMVCYDETLERYPWLEPPSDARRDWKDERAAADLSSGLEELFRTELPALHEKLDGRTYESARVNRRATWLKMSSAEGVSYSPDGRVALVGDSCHAMTPSLGEGC